MNKQFFFNTSKFVEWSLLEKSGNFDTWISAQTELQMFLSEIFEALCLLRFQYSAQ